MTAPPGGPTLLSRIEAATGRGGAVTFVSDEGAPRVEWTARAQAPMTAPERSPAAADAYDQPAVDPGDLEAGGGTPGVVVEPGPDATAAAFHDGWLRTGDLAYLVDGELVVCRRLKDVIIIGGRNLYPDEVERAVAAVDGVRAGNVVAFGVAGTGREELVVVAEVRVPIWPACAGRWLSGCDRSPACRPPTWCWWRRAASRRRLQGSSNGRCAACGTWARISSRREPAAVGAHDPRLGLTSGRA